MKKLLRLVFAWAAWMMLSAVLHAAGPITLTPRGNTVAVDVRRPPLDGKVTLNAPELINDPTRRLVYTETNLKSVNWKVGKLGALRSQWRKERLAAYEMTLTPEADGIRVDWIVTNLSPEAWKDVAGNIDMQSSPMPTFFDPAGNRIFLRASGRWVAAKDSWVEQGSNWYMPMGKQPLQIMRPLIEDHSWKLSKLNPDEAMLALQSRDGRWILAQAWKQAEYFIVNVRDNYQCAEAPPSFSEIGPGQTVHARGKVYLFPGNLDQLESKYQADLKAQHIYLRGPN